MKNAFCLSDLYTSNEIEEAAALFDGGWRSEDKNELIEEYGIEETHAKRLCDIFKFYEENTKEK